MNPYSDWKYPKLKKECNTRGLKMTGKKHQLVSRLYAYDLDFEQEAETPPPKVKKPKKAKKVKVPKNPRTKAIDDTAPDPTNHNYDLAGRWRRRTKGWIAWDEDTGAPIYKD